MLLRVEKCGEHITNDVGLSPESNSFGNFLTPCTDRDPTQVRSLLSCVEDCVEEY